MRRSALLTIALVATALAPASAHAATVSLESHLVPHPRAGQVLLATLTVSAASGERNDVAIGWNGDPSKPAEADFIITDTTAPLHPGAGCALVAAGAIACPISTATWRATKVDLGDGDDRLTVTALLSVQADGGPGDDRLDATGAGYAQLSGGDGADLLLGSRGPDQLLGGSGDDRLEGLGGNDVLRGGSDDATTPGTPAADAVLGGDGDDELFAAGRGSLLDGGAGADHLTATGPVVVRPGPGTDHVLAQQGGAYVDTREADGPARDLVRCSGGPAHLVILGDDDFSTGCGRHVRQDHPRAIALLNAKGEDERLWLGNLYASCADVSRPRCALRLSLRDEANGRVLAARRQTVQPGASSALTLPVPRKFVRRRDRIVNYIVSVRAPSGEVQTLRWRAWIPGGKAKPTNGFDGRSDGGPLR